MSSNDSAADDTAGNFSHSSQSWWNSGCKIRNCSTEPEHINISLSRFYDVETWILKNHWQFLYLVNRDITEQSRKNLLWETILCWIKMQNCKNNRSYSLRLCMKLLKVWEVALSTVGLQMHKCCKYCSFLLMSLSAICLKSGAYKWGYFKRHKKDSLIFPLINKM